MAFLDPSIILLDPMLASRFTVTQRLETISSGGLSTYAPVITKNVVGVVVPATPDDLERLDDQDRGRRTIKIYTRFRLNSAAMSQKPDVITWQNNHFIVKDVQPYTQFGAGWTDVLATSVDSIEAQT